MISISGLLEGILYASVVGRTHATSGPINELVRTEMIRESRVTIDVRGMQLSLCAQEPYTLDLLLEIYQTITPTFSSRPHPRIALMGLDGRSSPFAND